MAPPGQGPSGELPTDKAPAAPRPEPLERLGRYRLIERLGQGGMATVWRAEDEQLRRDVALKLMLPDLASSAEAAGRFQREARAVAALRHPNILQVHDYAPEQAGRPAFLVAELIRGPTLKQFMASHGAPLPEVAALIGVMLARALGAAHAAGIVHRDVKPENVMIDEGRRIVLCDFGIARMVAVDDTMTRTGALIGSPAYMSPEQADGQDLDGRSDLFSLGTVLYQLSTGTLPFVAPQPLALLAKIHRAEHSPPSAKNPRVPPYLERVIERCLRKLPADRPRDAGEIVELLEAGLRADGLSAIEDELASYFRDPPAFNAAAEPRIVAASIAQAREAVGRGESAKAIGLCNRVLAWRPDDSEARALLAGIGRRGRLRELAIGVAAAVVALGGGATAWQLYAHRQPVPVAIASPARAPTITTATTAPTGTGSAAPPGPATPPATPPAQATGSLPRRAEPRVDPAPISAAAKIASRPARAPSPAPGDAARVRPPALIPPPEVPPPVAAPPPSEGKITLDVRPFCKGQIDGRIAIAHGETVAVAPGSHHVDCAGPNGTRFARDIEVAAGETRRVEGRLLGRTRVDVKLRTDEELQIDGFEGRVRDGMHIELDPGTRQVSLYKGGQKVAGRYLEVPGVARCTLGSDPLECVKP